MHPLAGPRLKIAHAKAEIERLKLEEETFNKNTHYRPIKTGFNKKTQKDIYCVHREGPPPPLEWGVYIGEITHDLRSALDNLVYQLALLGSDPKTVAKDTSIQFPMFLHFDAGKSNFKKSRQRMIGLLRREDQARIERLQPYHRRNRAKYIPPLRCQQGNRNSPLWWLQEINNADKHRLIQVIDVQSGISPGISAYGDDLQKVHWFRLHILDNGVKMLEAPHNVRVHGEYIPLMTFADGCDVVKLRSVHSVLDQMTAKVEEIVESFASEF